MSYLFRRTFVPSSNKAYIIIDEVDINKKPTGYKITAEAHPYQLKAYNDFTTTIDRTDIKTKKKYQAPLGSFQLQYNERMITDDYKNLVLVNYIRDDGRPITYMSADEDFLKDRAAFINRLTDPWSAGGRKLTRRHRKLTRRHRKSTRRRRRKH